MSRSSGLNGKPLRHWKKMADELVMDCLVRAIADLCGSMPDRASLPQQIAAARLIEIAKAENEPLYHATCDTRKRCISNLNQFKLALSGCNKTRAQP